MYLPNHKLNSLRSGTVLLHSLPLSHSAKVHNLVLFYCTLSPPSPTVHILVLFYCTLSLSPTQPVSNHMIHFKPTYRLYSFSPSLPLSQSAITWYTSNPHTGSTVSLPLPNSASQQSNDTLQTHIQALQFLYSSTNCKISSSNEILRRFARETDGCVLSNVVHNSLMCLT